LTPIDFRPLSIHSSHLNFGYTAKQSKEKSQQIIRYHGLSVQFSKEYPKLIYLNTNEKSLLFVTQNILRKRSESMRD